MGMDFGDAFGNITLLDGQITTTNTSLIFPAGQIFFYRMGTDRKMAGLVKWVLMDNNGCTLGDVLIGDTATTGMNNVMKAATSDRGGLPVGFAAATIASNTWGFAIIGGYVEKGAISMTVATGEYLTIGGSTAGAATPNRASVFNAGTQGNASAFQVFCKSRGAVATTSTLVASLQMVGVWG